MAGSIIDEVVRARSPGARVLWAGRPQGRPSDHDPSASGLLGSLSMLAFVPSAIACRLLAGVVAGEATATSGATLRDLAVLSTSLVLPVLILAVLLEWRGRRR